MDMGTAVEGSTVVTMKTAPADSGPVTAAAGETLNTALTNGALQTTNATLTLRPASAQAQAAPAVRSSRLPMTMYLHCSLTDYFLVESLQLTSPRGVLLL